MNAPERLTEPTPDDTPVPERDSAAVQIKATPPEAPLLPLPRSSAASVVLATLATVATLWWGQRFMIPVVAGVLLALLLGPVVVAVERLLRSRAVSTVFALLLFIAVVGTGGTIFGGQLMRVTERIPQMISLAAQRVGEARPAGNSVWSQARRSLRDLDRAASRALGVSSAGSNNANPEPLSERATVVLRDTAFSGSGMLLKFASDMTIVLFTAFFVLLGGRSISERFLDQWSYHPEARHRAASALREAGRQVRLYAGVLLITNTIIGVAVWLAFTLTGLPDAAGWGVTAAVLHLVPYLGMALLTGLAGAESFLAHGTWGAMLGMAAFVVALSTIVGTLVTAWLQGHAARMSPTTVFIGLVFWGALWGVWGLFLGPVLAVLFKVVAEHSRAGRRLARLMQD